MPAITSQGSPAAWHHSPTWLSVLPSFCLCRDGQTTPKHPLPAGWPRGTCRPEQTLITTRGRWLLDARRGVWGGRENAARTKSHTGAGTVEDDTLSTPRIVTSGPPSKHPRSFWHLGTLLFQDGVGSRKRRRETGPSAAECLDRQRWSRRPRSQESVSLPVDGMRWQTAD